jgi:hypothetical protein
MTSIIPGIYYGADGIRNFTEDGKYAQIKDGVISSTESITIGSTAGNHMVLSENTGTFKFGYLNSSGEINTSLELGSGARGKNSVVILPYTDYVGFGSSAGMYPKDFIQKLIPWICANYPHRTRNLFMGVCNVAAMGIFMICIYDTSLLQNGVPQYAFGQLTYWNNGIYNFGYNNYTFYFKTLTQT